MKTILKRTLFVMLLFTNSNLLFSQVSFTNQANLLSPISGSGYQDCGVDMNDDYLDDVVRVTDNGIYIDYQQADGTFEQTFFAMDIQNPPDWSICAGDLSGNGYNDLIFGNGQRVSFCFANDDGTAYTEDPRPEYIFSQRSTMADIDNDGNLDAFVNHDVDQSHPYRNDGSGNMILDQTLIETLDVGGNYAAIWVDYDNDNDIDLYITKCRGGAPEGDARRINLLYQNNGDGTFSSVGPEANMDDGDQSWTTVFEDFDNDGDFDAYTVNHETANRLMENNGDGTFTNIIAGSGIDEFDLGAWDLDAGDFDNNGYIDIFSQMTKELYLNNGDGTFTGQDLPFDMGGIGDYNDDGFLDVIMDDNLWINNGNENNWIKVGCKGLVSNNNGIGARIEIYGEWGMQIREIRAGESFRPMSSLVEHFGIGEATAITQLVVKWPSGVVTTIDNPEINKTIIVTEADCFTEDNSINVIGSSAFCEGDSVQLVADLGVAYNWSNGDTTQSITVSSEGTYSVIIWNEENCASVSDNVSVNYIVDEPAEITINGESVICQGDEVVLSANDGAAYLWSNGEETQSIVVIETGNFSVSVDAFCSSDQSTSEPVSIEMLETPQLPEVEDVTINAPGMATLSATGENLLWYDDAFAAEPIGQGPTLETEFFEDQISYWVEANNVAGGTTAIGGKADNSGGGGISNVDGLLVFDALEDIILKEVTIYVLDQENSGAGMRTFTLYDEALNILDTHTEFFDVGTHQVILNFDIPKGNGYRIGCNEHNIFRNNNGVNYPFLIDDLARINTSSNGDAYYYYFYNWVVETPGYSCASDRVEVSATVGIAEFEQLSSFKLYPNPAATTTSIIFTMKEQANITVFIRDILGRIVYQNVDYSATIGENKIEFDVSSWSPGMYLLNFEINGQTKSNNFIVE